MINKYIVHSPERIVHNEKRKENSKGFTLIELIIVMVTIAILSGLSLFALQGARRQGRDARRRSDLESVRSALELYKADCNLYPASLPAVGSALSATCTGSSNTYIQSIPGDPTSSANYYYNRTSTTTYDLCSHLEDSSAGAPAGCASCDPSPCRYRVRNP